MRKDFWFQLLNLRFFVGGVIVGEGLGFSGPCQWGLGLNPKNQFLSCFLIETRLKYASLEPWLTI